MKSVDVHPVAGGDRARPNAEEGLGVSSHPGSSLRLADAMPVTVRYSAALDRTYEEADSTLGLPPPPVSPTPTDSSRASGCSTPSRTDVTTASSSATHDGDFGFPNRTNSVDSLDGGSSVGSGGHSRQMSSDSTEFIPTRTIKTNVKPAHNPLQFVKTSRSVLVEKAELQIRQFEEVKKVKERVKEDEEAWQSNLDNWKSKRRQISSRPQGRTDLSDLQDKEDSVEWQKKKSKTFSEMMEERSRRGSTKLQLYSDWSGEESSNHSGRDSAPKAVDGSFESSESDHAFEDDLAHRQVTPMVSNGSNNTNGTVILLDTTDGHGVDRDPPQEYTFEKAIQSYTQYAESRTRNHRPTSASPQLSDSGLPSSASISPGKTNGEWDMNEYHTHQHQDSLERSTVPTDIFQRAETNGRSNSSPYDMKTSTPDLSAPPEVAKLNRAEGEELFLVVSLRRGADNKDFGFSIKSVRGVGTGIFVETVHPQSPAESAGLKVDDEILAINGEYCSSKRTHSAIVFAIKQAVYTGRLELAIYRYRNTEFLHVREPLSTSSPVSAIESPQQLYRSSSGKITAGGAVVGSRESSPGKVDIVKRRSLFELSASPRQSPEKTVNRRSLDVSVNFKDKLASFQSMESGVDSSRPERRKPVEQGMSFKEKLASFESLDSFDRSIPAPQSSWSEDSGRQKSLENVSRVRNNERPREDAHYQSYQAFERTRSCEVLDFDCPSNVDGRQEVTDWPVAGRSNSGLFRAVPNSESPSGLAVAGHEVTGGYALDVKAPETISAIDLDVIESAAPLDNKPSFTDSSLRQVSGFELAASLEETPITGSLPSSPLDSKVPPVPLVELAVDDQQLDHSVLSISTEHSFEDTSALSYEADLDSEVVIVDGVEAPTKQLEPPKEKPPPPPIEPDGSDDLAVENVTNEEFKRENSTKRIRKEIWKRRSDFLGIDPEDVQNFIENEISQVSPPPKVENLLREELNDRYDSRQELLRLEQERSQLLAKAEFAETGIAVGSTVKLDGLDNRKNESIDEEEMARKEREIIENLEWEEFHRRQDRSPEPQSRNSSLTSDQQHQHLQDRFLQHREAVDEVSTANVGVQDRPDEDWKLKQREAELQRQEELLRMEKEKLRREQEELLRQKQEYQRQINHHQQRSSSVPGPVLDLGATSPLSDHAPCNGNLLGSPIYDYVKPDLLLADGRSRSGPPPPPPSKPKLNSSLSLESETSRPPAVRPSRHSEIVSPMTASGALQPLTKQTLYALSASPKAKLVEGDQWMVARRKTDGPRHDNHNQHWLVQEAEFRRLHPQQQNGVQRLEERPTLLATSPSSSSRPDWSSPSATGQWNGARLPQNLPSRTVDQQRLPAGQHLSRTPSVPSDQWHHDLDPKSPTSQPPAKPGLGPKPLVDRETQMLSVSGKKKCSHCGDELGRGAAMIIESLQLFYHINCFKCCVCHVQLGNGMSGADVRVRSQKLHCHNCYSNDEGLKFSKV